MACDPLVTLHIVNGAATDSLAVTSGRFLYVTEIVNDVTWAGPSPWGIAFNAMALGAQRIVDFLSPWPTTRLATLVVDAPDATIPSGWDFNNQYAEGVWRPPYVNSGGYFKGCHPIVATGSLAMTCDFVQPAYNAAVTFRMTDLDPNVASVDAINACLFPGGIFAGEPGGGVW